MMWYDDIYVYIWINHRWSDMMISMYRWINHRWCDMMISMYMWINHRWCDMMISMYRWINHRWCDMKYPCIDKSIIDDVIWWYLCIDESIIDDVICWYLCINESINRWCDDHLDLACPSLRHSGPPRVVRQYGLQSIVEASPVGVHRQQGHQLLQVPVPAWWWW